MLKFPRSIYYMYWQKRFERKSPDEELFQKILEIKAIHKDYGYRRMHGELLKQRCTIEKYTTAMRS